MKCKNCPEKDLTEDVKAYRCTGCGLTIWKQVGGHRITTEELQQLLTKGETEKYFTLISQDRKPYRAKLAIQGNQLEKQYENSKSQQEGDMDANAVRVRAESPKPGSVNLDIKRSDKQYRVQINFGLASTRECECLAVLAAIDYIKFHFPEHKNLAVHIEVNSQEFANYLLKETTPRDKDMRNMIGYTWGKLSAFKTFVAMYKPRQKMKLEGTNTSRYYPKGLFPWIEKSMHESDQGILVLLSSNPAVIKQFWASFHKAEYLSANKDEADQSTEEENEEELTSFLLPSSYYDKLNTWFSIVMDTTA